MTTTQISVATAPRDIPGLKNLGRFNMRILAQELGGLDLEETKTAFMQQTTDEQAAFVHRLLAEKDGTGGKASKGAGGASPRQPSTKGAAGKSNGAASKAAGEPAQSTGGGGTASASVGAGAEKILAAINALNTRLDEFQEGQANLQAAVQQLQVIGAGTNRFVALAIGLSGKLAEQTLGAGLGQIIDVVLEDMPMIEAAMQRMAPVADADDEETTEGNEE